MKTYIFILLILSTLIHAVDNHGPACESKYFDFTDDKRYFDIGLSISGYAKADERTIEIDKKNKMIKVWIFTLASEKGREDIIRFLGENDDFSNYGYAKDLHFFDYRNMRIKTLQSHYHNCDGAPIRSSVGDKWSDIIPGSMTERIVDTIVKRYKLK